MKNKWKLKSAAITSALAILLTGCFNSGGSMDGMNHSNMTMDGESPPSNESSSQEEASGQTGRVERLTGKEFTLTAKISNQEIAPGNTFPVWTFNNSVPGPELRVQQGETVEINLINELPEPVTIHWHGIPVPNNMDGIPGVTQNAVQPGESFTYEFKAEFPGTYWYHSHQDGVNQLDRGLYGSFIVEPKEGNSVDRDYTLVLDEWMSSGMDMSGMDMSDMNSGNMDMSDMDHGNMNIDDSMDMGHDMSMYDLYTINGKSGSLIDPLAVKEGEDVRIRLVNAGYMSHQIHLHGHEFKVTAVDGQPINSPGIVQDNVITIAPGERYDIEFEANNPGQWLIEGHGENQAVKGMKATIAYEGAAVGSDQPNESVQLPAVDISRYGEARKMSFTLDQQYTLDYTMDLGTKTENGKTVYTINGKTYPNTDPIHVKKGDTVKVRLINNSEKDDHPMHLHGHFFQVLSKDGKPLEGSPIIKDTINLKPGEEYVVAFEADNEGNWMFHCHDLHHASDGMVTELMYADFKPDFVPDPNAGNKPE
ncbi:multicopper oxidase family protein [Paenibacillus sp. 1P07SE]|uniref:multicopper oxidase family protein n=1 Tax=Paenibacillus sp. 1P07SE TaxID=3132209 RepID=UPI0039A55389